MRLSPSEDRVVFPAVPTSVTVGADIPSWTYDYLRRFHQRTRSWLILVSPLPASALVFADSALTVLPRAAALLHPFECHRHPSLVLRRPSGYCRRPAAVPSVVVVRRPLGSAPLMGFCSLQRSRAQRIRFFVRGLPHPQPLRPQGFYPLDALIPFVPSRHFCRGRSWDCSLQGFTPPADPDSLSRIPSPPGFA